MSKRTFAVDLHCHTRMSDNDKSIEEVLRIARGNGVTHLAVTDHDTTAGLAEAARLGGEIGIEIVPGIEISAYDFRRKRRAHVLGLFVEPGHAALEELCRPTVELRDRLSRKMVDRLIEAGYRLSWPQVQAYAAGGTGVYKQHIMHALMDEGYCDAIYSPLYRELFSRGEGGEPGIAHLPMTYVDAFDAIEAVAKAGGVPILAHPGQLGNFEAVEEWAEAGLRGIEAYHPSHLEEHVALALDMADRFGLFVTGGADYHGFYGDPECLPGDCGVDLGRLESLKAEAALRGGVAR
ncbi:PHP domain-containing protein [Cohnella zeiphila]|uniref:PHP domain-containing protein n=1 Tax=Cohnella zeiphila TaxID=2761120 RepID=A0A7X0W0K5_9BACL|nr:PHP domain-containing protein [Cohnella zeiphila]MBB6735158.1 PHP domain-containing protein [Cohnella zeiphila]